MSRTYVKLDAPLTYRKWIDGLREGRSYLSDGRAHLMDFRVNGGLEDVRLRGRGRVNVAMKAAVLLDKTPNLALQKLPYDQKPYWTVERARIGETNEVAVELVVNGKVVAVKNVVGDGAVRDVEFEVEMERSAWVAARVLPAAHTNPVCG